ncbi:hypothetical protein Tco_0137668 [Tanacetum coccineum]
MASDGSDQDARYTLSKLLQMGTVAEYERVSRWIKTCYNQISCWEKGDLDAITSKGGPPNHMRASEKELAVLKSPLEQKSMFRLQERCRDDRATTKIGLAGSNAKIQEEFWIPE